MKYFDYNDMKEFYPIPEVCRLFEMDKQELRKQAERYEVEPVEDQFGNWGLRKGQVRKLHNFIYKEQENGRCAVSVKRSAAVSDPWAQQKY